ncbi:5'-3' exonuclease [Deinococcus peraridilitoris]|uniref:5'-3' exonuclease (Including N-terminal domain of PolI) n=1 Tax=Deinococcus peraridilitoris (strain DSM 19664 / LMG 22246 / CIP 109416 / KR-200) TaxID=937777 RepID=L0A3A1_DEIPD|nr:5'-3' exonuclease H3TH domain-containing protein [Deinococcus peraridilitoris]AFZ67490.1 5'-3' exonuclease (including N-terminal domain of PolI) [Deinococcus peraridilitoris DSM 19664]
MAVSPLLIIDVQGLAYRSYSGLQSARRKEALERGQDPALLGPPDQRAALAFFARALARRLEEHRPRHAYGALEGGRTFREELFPAYKKNRAPKDEALRIFLQLAREVAARQLDVVEAPGFEADDVIASLAARNTRHELVIRTGDRDLYALVRDEGPRVTVYREDLRCVIDEAGVLREYGVTPAQVPLAKMLMGDEGDNIPGVSGLGKGRAARILLACPDLDTIWRKRAVLGKAEWRGLEACGYERLQLYLQLTTLRTDAPLRRPEGALSATLRTSA